MKKNCLFNLQLIITIICIFLPVSAKAAEGYIDATLSCSKDSEGNNPYQTKMIGVYDHYGFVLYHSFIDRDGKFGYDVIEGKYLYSWNTKRNGDFTIKGEGHRGQKYRWLWTFEPNGEGSIEGMLKKGFDGNEKNPAGKRPNNRDCKLLTRITNRQQIVALENKSQYQMTLISRLEKELKSALENTTELDAANSKNQELLSQIKSIEKDLFNKDKLLKSFKNDLNKSEKSTKSLNEIISQKENKITTLSKDIEQINDMYRKLKANTPEKYAEASAKLVQLQKQLEFETNSKLELKSSLEQQKMTSGKLADEILRLEKLDKENKEKIAKLSQGESIISSLEEQLEQAQYQQKLLLDARDRVIAGQADELLKLEKAALTQSRQEQEKITALASEITLLREELADKDARLAKVSALFAGTSTNQNSSAALPTASQVKTPDLNKKWSDFDNVLSIQQKQFCALTERFKDELEDARASKNDIKINMVFKNRQDDLDALMPAGRFANWVFKIVKIEQVEDGSAAVVAQLECETLVGSGYLPDKKSGFFESDTKSWRATIPYNDRRYRELAKLSAGQFVAGSGSLLEIGAYKPGQPETFYASMPVGDHPIVSKLGYEGELFVADFSYLAALSD